MACQSALFSKPVKASFFAEASLSQVFPLSNILTNCESSCRYILELLLIRIGTQYVLNTSKEELKYGCGPLLHCSDLLRTCLNIEICWDEALRGIEYGKFEAASRLCHVVPVLLHEASTVISNMTNL